jgi:hypothetical protein
MPSVIAATNTKQPEQKSSQVMVSNPMGQAQEVHIGSRDSRLCKEFSRNVRGTE